MARRRRTRRSFRRGTRRSVDMQTFVICRDQLQIDAESGVHQCDADETGPSGDMLDVGFKAENTASQSSLSKGWIFKGGHIELCHRLHYQDTAVTSPNETVEVLLWEALVKIPDQVGNDPRQFETGIPAYVPNLFRSNVGGPYDSYYDILWRRLSWLRTAEFTVTLTNSFEQLANEERFANSPSYGRTSAKVRARRRIGETDRLFYVRNAVVRRNYPDDGGQPDHSFFLETHGHIWYAVHHLIN